MTTETKIDFDNLILKSGPHNNPSNGLCFMEAVAYFRGIRHTDRPQCVSPAIGAFLRSWNDSLPDDDRQKLKPYIFKVVGTATTAEDEERRAWLATDWLVRTFTPAWLELAGLKDHAARLRALPELTTLLASAALGEIEAARSAAAAAWDAAWDAAWAAARAAARDAARDAAWAAAGGAAWTAAGNAAGAAAWAAAGDAAGAAAWTAAGNAAGAAAGNAAGAAAWAAAGAAAGVALQPTVVVLQTSAFELLDRLIAVGKTEDVPA